MSYFLKTSKMQTTEQQQKRILLKQKLRNFCLETKSHIKS